MALIRCDRCGQDVEDSADVCPHCGGHLPSGGDEEPGLLRGMGFDLLWYVPLCAGTFLFLVVPSVVAGYHNISLLIKHFDWGVWNSGATAVFVGAVFGSVLIPMQVLLIPGVMIDETKSKATRYRNAFLYVAGIVVAWLLLNVVIRWSFPYPVEGEGGLRLRLIRWIWIF